MAAGEPELTLEPDTAFFILLKAREFHAKVEEVDPDEGSNPTDDKDIDVLEFNPGDAVQEELDSAIAALNVDEQLDLMALIWIGRGEFELGDWAEARDGARRVVDAAQTAHYVRQHPTVSDDLEDGLAQFDLHLADYLDSGVVQPAPRKGEAES